MTNQDNKIKYISYARLSKQELKRNQLGLENQQELINNFVRSRGGEIYKSFQEFKSAKDLKRDQLAKALSYLKDPNTYLVVYKIDRLSRDLQDLLLLIRSYKYKILFVELGDHQVENKSQEFYFQLMGAIAQNERDLISQRTKLGIKKYREKHNNKWGNPKGYNMDLAREQAIKARQLKAIEKREQAINIYIALKALNKSNVYIVNELNKLNIKTPNNTNYTTNNIRLLERVIKIKDQLDQI